MSLLRRFWHILAPFHKVFYLFVFILVIYEGMQIATSYQLSMLIKIHSEGADTITWIIFFFGVLAFNLLLMFMDNIVDWHIVARQITPLNRHLKVSAIAKFMVMDGPWHSRRNSGTLVGKVNNGADKVAEIIDGMSWEFIPTFIQTILSALPLVIISPWAALVAGIAFLIFNWLTYKNLQERLPYKKERYDLYEIEWHKSMENVQSIETVRAFGQTDRLMKEFGKLHDKIVSLGIKEARVGIFKYNRLRISLIQFARIVILTIWVGQLNNGSMDIAGLVFAYVLLEKLFHSFWRLSRLFDRVTEAAEGADRLADILEEKPPVRRGGVIPEVVGPIGITLEEVCFAYDEEYSSDSGALHDLSLDIRSGSIVGLVGPSGAGKSSLNKIVTGEYPFQHGTIKVGNLDISEWDEFALREQFSYVPQGDGVYLHNDTVANNIAFPRPESSHEEIVRAAMLAGIHGFISSLPDGYQTIVGERGKRLSGGQKQRIALARAIIADRPIFILDEATSAVDAITEDEIQKQMSTILAGKTAIIIAHRLSTIWDIADKIVVFDNGYKVEEGTHSELMRNDALYAQMVRLQRDHVRC